MAPWQDRERRLPGRWQDWPARRRTTDDAALPARGPVEGTGRELRGDRLLVAAGRRPCTGGLGLDTVGVTADGHGIPVDATCAPVSAWGHRRRHRPAAADSHGQVTGR